MEHWVTSLIAKSCSGEHQSEMSNMRKELVHINRTLQRSRSPRGKVSSSIQINSTSLHSQPKRKGRKAEARSAEARTARADVEVASPPQVSRDLERRSGQREPAELPKQRQAGGRMGGEAQEETIPWESAQVRLPCFDHGHGLLQPLHCQEHTLAQGLHVESFSQITPYFCSVFAFQRS